MTEQRITRQISADGNEFMKNIFNQDLALHHRPSCFILILITMSDSNSIITAEKTSSDLVDKAKPQENPVASKKLYETYWRLLFLLIVGVSTVIMSKVYKYQTLPLFESNRKGSIADLLWMGLPVMVVFTVLDHAVHLFLDDWFLNNYINEAKYPEMDRRKKRCYTFTKWAFSELYYLPCAIWAYLILRPTSFMPVWLGGNGDPTRMIFNYLSFDEATEEMRYFYVLQFGKHLSRFFSHVFIRSEGNFYEYALHHGLSTFLIFFSYLTNMWLIGIMVLLFHDITDFSLILCRMYRDCRVIKKWLLTTFDVVLVILWFCGRIFFFSYGCIYSSFCAIRDLLYSGAFSLEQIEVLFWPSIFMSFMMVCLQGLQLFWTYYIFSSFLAVQITTKVKHTYD